ncbi:ATP binding protein, putative [Ricinus communis]|uniref:ATP binding protein, putative n=1 Tax=Ricinus communis TaxID=3988 RepID=B9RGZ0_RICCO|nr:ATP binding protein, putative [Ricinus communis]
MEGEEDMHNHGVSWWRGPLIGKGGFGSVYLANLKEPKSRNRIYPSVMAVKSAEVSESASLQKEKEVFDNLYDCPYILQCYGEETTTNKAGVMFYDVLLEYASGGTLASLIKQSGGCGLPELDVKRYTRSILQGINCIHSNGYVHCDLKPDNILLVSIGGSDGKFVPKIGDFGLAKKVVKSKKRKLGGSYIGGTTLYMAPETVIDHIQEAPSDIWALGCIVFEMFTGKKVWDSKPDMTTNELLEKIGECYEPPKMPSQISKDGKDFLKRCLVKKSAFRFTAEMLLNHPFLSGLGVSKPGNCVDDTQLHATVYAIRAMGLVS